MVVTGQLLGNQDCMTISNCSMGCLYAEGGLDKCICKCGKATHGLLALKQTPVFIECSPAVEKRCKAGLEGGECRCACQGTQHGLYASVENFESIPVHTYC